VPEQASKAARDAYETARALGGELASFGAVVMDVNELQKAKDRYLLAADPTNLPKETGWYRVDRDTSNNIIAFFQIDDKEAEGLRRAGRMFDVLHVDRSTMNAAAARLPVVLVVDYAGFHGRYLVAGYWPYCGEGYGGPLARVALAGPGQAGRVATVQNAEIAGLRRVDERLNESGT
jgi:hypothetical protein